MESFKKALPFYIAMILNFYLLPLFIVDTGSAIIVLLIFIPSICFAISAVYGIKNGFHFEYAAIVAILFIPSIFIYYNTSAWVYIVGYGIIALLGNLVSLLFKKDKTN